MRISYLNIRYSPPCLARALDAAPRHVGKALDVIIGVRISAVAGLAGDIAGDVNAAVPHRAGKVLWVAPG